MEILATLEIKDIFEQNYLIIAKMYMSYAYSVLKTNTHGFKYLFCMVTKIRSNFSNFAFRIKLPNSSNLGNIYIVHIHFCL